MTEAVEDLSSHVPGGDPHATCPILPSSQAAGGDQAIPAQGSSFRHTCRAPKG